MTYDHGSASVQTPPLVIEGRTMSDHHMASNWFTGLDGPTRAAVLAHGGGPMPRWMTDSLRGARLPTLSAKDRNGPGDYMTPMLKDFLTIDAPGLDLWLNAPAAPAA
jgi:hypothetical protein